MTEEVTGHRAQATPGRVREGESPVRCHAPAPRRFAHRSRRALRGHSRRVRRGISRGQCGGPTQRGPARQAPNRGRTSGQPGSVRGSPTLPVPRIRLRLVHNSCEHARCLNVPPGSPTLHSTSPVFSGNASSLRAVCKLNEEEHEHFLLPK